MPFAKAVPVNCEVGFLTAHNETTLLSMLYTTDGKLPVAVQQFLTGPNILE